ncbi:11469_t:CDS:2 [Ambispora gerdemannii]|uniref:11469_t:CDS:1 n=1 Tax=Ambispora gerdemannii TaxID=144530 RepID=A0A9N9AZH7_9GLOM|nr:11469_t:CDS:2 [Ambispora gerdemannii]
MVTTTDANPFGQGIPFRQGKPIQLVSIVNGKFVVNLEAANGLLEKFQQLHQSGSIKVVSVVGNKHTGKSHLANLLHGRHDGFALGNYLDVTTTRGIQIWDTPFNNNDGDNKDTGNTVLVLDYEGFDDFQRDEKTQQKLFLLALLISDTLVYTIDKSPNTQNMKRLFAANNLIELLRKKSFAIEDENEDVKEEELRESFNDENDEKEEVKEEELRESFDDENDEKEEVKEDEFRESFDVASNLFVVIKDFMFDLSSSSFDLTDFFMEKMDFVDPDDSAAFEDNFPVINVHGIPPPGLGLKDLRKMNTIPTDRFDKSYVKELAITITEILSSLKSENDNSMNSGDAFVKRLNKVLDFVNDDSRNIKYFSATTMKVKNDLMHGVETVWREIVEPGLQKETPFGNESILRRKLNEFSRQIFAQYNHIDESPQRLKSLIEEKEKLAVKKWKSLVPTNIAAIVDFKVNSSDFRGLPWPEPNWKWDKTDLNAGHGGKFIHIGYKLTDVKIDNLEFYSPPETNRGFLWNSAGRYWTHTDCVTALSYIAYDEPRTTKPPNWDFWYPQDLSEGAGGKYIYLVWNACGDKPPVTEIYFEFTDDNAPPEKEGWVFVEQDLCAGSKGQYLWGFYHPDLTPSPTPSPPEE